MACTGCNIVPFSCTDLRRTNRTKFTRCFHQDKPLMPLESHKCPALRPHDPYIILFHSQFHTSQRCGSVEQSDKVRITSHFSLSHEPFVILYLQFYISQRCISVEQSDKVRIMTHFYPSHEPLSFFTYSSTLLIIVGVKGYFSAVQKCGKSVESVV